jgi:hypothetical protein
MSSSPNFSLNKKQLTNKPGKSCSCAEEQRRSALILKALLAVPQETRPFSLQTPRNVPCAIWQFPNPLQVLCTILDTLLDDGVGNPFPNRQS